MTKLIPEYKGNIQERKLGILEGKGKMKFDKNFKISEDEFLSNSIDSHLSIKN